MEFSQSAADRICDLLMDGQSLRSICKSDDLPSMRTVFKWLGQNEAFAQQYTRARDIHADAVFEEIREISDTPVLGVKTVSKPTGTETTEGDMIEHRRLQIDARKWLLGKMAPKKYGDKSQIEHSGSVGFDLSNVADGDLRQLERILAASSSAVGNQERD